MDGSPHTPAVEALKQLVARMRETTPPIEDARDAPGAQLPPASFCDPGPRRIVPRG